MTSSSEPRPPHILMFSAPSSEPRPDVGAAAAPLGPSATAPAAKLGAADSEPPAVVPLGGSAVDAPPAERVDDKDRVERHGGRDDKDRVERHGGYVT